MNSFAAVASILVFTSAGLFLTGCQTVSADGMSSASTARPQVTELRRDPCPSDPAQEIVMARVDFPPRASSTPHRHPGSVSGFVVEGDFDFQVEGQPEQHLKAGDTFYEPPGATHVVSTNPRKGAATVVVVYMLQPKGRELVVPLAH